MSRSKRKTAVTALTPARARALASNAERLDDALLAAADETDFNDEPARFASVLAQLKSPPSPR